MNNVRQAAKKLSLQAAHLRIDGMLEKTKQHPTSAKAIGYDALLGATIAKTADGSIYQLPFSATNGFVRPHSVIAIGLSGDRGMADSINS